MSRWRLRPGCGMSGPMQPQPAIKALIQLRKGGLSGVGPDRIGLLELIREKGSISAAAKAMGLSYKGAWDAVQAINNLFERPLVVAQPGGKAGGAAVITPVGEAVLLAYRKVESELSGVIAQLEQHLADANAPIDRIVRSLSMKTSARNALRGEVVAVTDGAVNAEVVLRVSEAVSIVAIITRRACASSAWRRGARRSPSSSRASSSWPRARRRCRSRRATAWSEPCCGTRRAQ